MPHPSMGRRPFAVTILAAALLAFPLAALATHQFVDVPDSNPFHDDISALADSGVTTGCGGGNFCPSAFVTREQMAAFLNRLGNLDGETGHWTCSGRDMQPFSSGLSYSVAVSSHYMASGGGHFGCPVFLPDGATITAFRGYITDSSAVGYAECGLNMFPPTTFSIGSLIASPPFSSVAGTSNDEVLEDLSVTSPVIDNSLNAYSAYCYVSGPNVYVNGVQIEYTVKGLPVI